MRPIDFQAACGNAVDEKRKFWDTWTVIWKVEAAGFVWPQDPGRLFHQPSADAMRKFLSTFRAGCRVGLRFGTSAYAQLRFPTKVETRIDLLTLLEAKCEESNLCNRSVFMAMAVRGVRPFWPPVRHLARQSYGRHPTARVSSGTRLDAAPDAVSEASGHAVAVILYDLLTVFDHVAYQMRIDTAVPTSYPLRQLR